jgi:hypothetical protein
MPHTNQRIPPNAKVLGADATPKANTLIPLLWLLF